jgi:methionyl-tRNA formyltransferase
MRIVFMGSPDFAVPALRAIHQRFNLVGVVSQPDRPGGRGRKLRAPPIKVISQELGVPILQPETLKNQAVLEHIESWEPDLIVVNAYGQILPPNFLTIAENNAINVHASLLPRWRGAAPIQASILMGDSETGITIMKMDAGMDTGPIISQISIPIRNDETGGELGERLSNLGADLLIETIPEYVAGNIVLTDQEDSLATYAPQLKKADGRLDFLQPADPLVRQVRAYEPWPTSFFYFNDLRLTVRKAHTAPGLAQPGLVVQHDNFPAIGTESGLVVLDLIQPAGRKTMPADAFVRGSPEFIDSNIG